MLWFEGAGMPMTKLTYLVNLSYQILISIPLKLIY